jgi:hypothetical protein
MHRHNSDKHKNIPIYVVMVGHISDMADIYLTWQTYVVFVRHVSNQIRIFRQNDSLYVGMVGHISDNHDIYRDNHDIYRGFRSMSVFRYISRLFLSN